MAINPNTTFTAASVLTADQMNRLPWGIVARGEKTTTQNITTETVVVTSNTFTAVADRYYRITFACPKHYKSSGTGSVTWRIRKTNASGTQYSGTIRTISDTHQTGMTLVVVTTLDAGSQEICGTVQSATGTISPEPNATHPAQIIVEDIGPA